MVLELEVQLGVSSMKSNRFSTPPWVTPVISVMAVELVLPLWTVWGLSVRMSRIQSQVGVFSSSRSSLPISC